MEPLYPPKKPEATGLPAGPGGCASQSNTCLAAALACPSDGATADGATADSEVTGALSTRGTKSNAHTSAPRYSRSLCFMGASSSSRR
ncbi:hypothetical protein GCM10009738_77100 [Kitasatospora viridis]